MNSTSKDSSVYARLRCIFSFCTTLLFCAVFFALVTIFSTPVASFAEEKSGIQVVLPNMIEFIPMLIAFIIVAFVLYKFGWPKFEEMLEKRKNTIQDSLKEAEEKKQQADVMLEDYQKQLDSAKDEAAEIKATAKKEANEAGNKIEEEARNKANAATEKAKVSIEQSKKLAQQEIKAEAVDIAMTAVAKFVSKDLTDTEHRKLIEKYVKEAGSLAG